MNDEDLERHVATALHELYPEPVGHMAAIRREPRRRAARAAAIVGATAAVAALGISVGLLQPSSPRGSGQPTPTRSAASSASHATVPDRITHGTDTVPDALVSSSWKLTTIQRAHGSARNPSAAVELRVDRDGTMQMACNTATASIRPGRIVFHQAWINNLMQCKDLRIEEYNFVYGQVLDGTVTWSITNQQLTITKSDVGSVIFTKAALRR